MRFLRLSACPAMAAQMRRVDAQLGDALHQHAIRAAVPGKAELVEDLGDRRRTSDVFGQYVRRHRSADLGVRAVPEVRRIKSRFANPGSDVSMVSAGGAKTKSAKNIRERHRLANDGSEQLR